MYNVNYNYHQSIIKLSLPGVLTLKVVEEIAKELYSNCNEKNILLLTDARGVTYDFNFEDFTGLMEMINQYIRADSIIHEAILIDSPIETAISTMFELENNRENHLFKIFSTESAAINWLLNNKK